MLVLVMGHRRGLTKALEHLDVPYCIWNLKPIKSKTKSLQSFIAPYPKTKDELLKSLNNNLKITHIIAGTEEAVTPASEVRGWLNARRNPHNVIVLCTDKLKMKEYLSQAHIPMTKFLDATKAAKPGELLNEFGMPIVVKPRVSSGGRGLKKVRQESELEAELKDGMMLEKYIKGSEGSVESFIHHNEILFTNITEYQQLGHCNLVPATYDKELCQKILELNSKVIKALKINWGMTHLEFYQTESGLLFGEIALRPPGGYLMEALGLAYKLDFWEQFARIELDLEPAFKIDSTAFAASLVLHPEAGTVTEITGLDKVKELESFRHIKIKMTVGDKVETRLGVGNDIGHVLLCHPRQEQLLSDIKNFEQNFNISTLSDSH